VYLLDLNDDNYNGDKSWVRDIVTDRKVDNVGIWDPSNLSCNGKGGGGRFSQW
jgi:hypothetical protein